MKRRRLDEILLERGMAQDKKDAFVIVTEGRVFIGGQKAISPAQMIGDGVEVRVANADGYVGRGAYKLDAALAAFAIDATGKICVDIGAATGGFTEVLLRRGAKKVYAIDTARGKLDLKIRQDPRVVVMEQTDVRDVRDVRELPESVDLAVIDISLISLRDILPHAGRMLSSGGRVIALFKPQYETRDPRMLRHGIVKDPESREKLLADFRTWLDSHGWETHDWMESPITGSKGNAEYIFYIAPK